MADPRAVATSDKKEKSSILDDEIGKDILISWKSISVTKDGEDFNLESMGKSKKKDFDFGKLDMDFDLGGDFGKISSFKMDVSDLDFSFSPKKNKKATETTEGDSGRGNPQGKEDRFNFSFDFDKFDFDATLSKVDTLSSKQKDIEKHDTHKTGFQVSEIQENEVTIADIVNKPKIGQASETIESMEVQDLADNHHTLITGNHPSIIGTSGDIVSQLDAETSSDKAVHSGRENVVDCSYLPVDQPIIQDFDVQYMPTNNLGLDGLIEPLEEGCSSGKIVNVGGEQNTSYEAAAEVVQQKSPERILPQFAERPKDSYNENSNLSDSNGKVPSVYIEEIVGWGSDLARSPKIVQGETSELSKDYNDGNSIASNTSAYVKQSSDGVSDSHDATVASAVKILHREMETQLSPLSCREPMVDKSAKGKEKETQWVRSKFVGKSNETNKPGHESSVCTKSKSLNMCTIQSDYPPEIREAIAREKQLRITGEDGSVSHKKVAKGEHTLLRNQRTLITAKENSLQIDSSESKEKSNKKEPQKSEKANVTSFTDCTQSIRHISKAKDESLPLKSVTRNLGLTDLKSSRCAAGKKLQSVSATMNEIKSLKDLKQNVTENVTPKVAVLKLTEKHKPGTPTLKRKQAPTGGLVHETPLKRLSQSPKNNSINNTLEMKIQDQMQHKSNIMDINTSSHSVVVPKIQKFGTPGQMNSSALEIPSEIGDFGMVEKAAAYGKELDDLCSMLRKKNEEAKELLVRAVVNNNNLLLLNHPMQDDKIRSVQKLANRLMAMKIVSRPVRAIC